MHDFYNSVATRYDAFIRLHHYVGPRWLAHALRELPAHANVIDFGCASGVLGNAIRQYTSNAQMIGIDISNEMLDVASTSFHYDALHEHDLNKPVPLLETASADLLVAFGFIEFILTLSVFLSGACRCLRPNACLLISFQEHRPDEPGVTPLTTQTAGAISHHAYTVDEVGAFLQKPPLTF